MAKKEFTYRGKTIDDLKKLSHDEFMQLLPARQRRSMKRGLSDQHKKLLKKISEKKKNIETHVKNLPILPEMIGSSVKVHNGKEWVPVDITEEMIGHMLGEFVLTRRKVEHSAPGIGATKSSSALSVK